MKRRFIPALAAALLLIGCGQQQGGSLSGSPALWAIERSDGEAVGWLFGTIHALPDGARWRTPMLERVTRSADGLLVEVRDLDPARIAGEFERRAADERVPPLMNRVSGGDRAKLRDLLETRGVASRRLDRLETWAAALALAQLGDAVDPGNSVDKALISDFEGRPVRELEGAAAQLEIFDDLPERAQRAMLGAVLAEQESARADATALARAWLAGDLPQLERRARRGILAEPELYDALLLRRNRSWAKSILTLLADGKRPLVAVGSAHLLGPDGLPAALATAGYRVRRIQ